MHFHEHATALKADMARLQKELIDKDISLQALSGAILQIAKQGLSLVHGGLKGAPCVRTLAPSPLTLSAVVWEGRNQAMHYEAGDPHEPVKECFHELHTHFGSRFDLAAHSNRSRARQVLEVLGWTDYLSYLKDMQALLTK